MAGLSRRRSVLLTTQSLSHFSQVVSSGTCVVSGEKRMSFGGHPDHHVAEANVVCVTRHSSADAHEQAQLDGREGAPHVRGHRGGSTDALRAIRQECDHHVVCPFISPKMYRFESPSRLGSLACSSYRTALMSTSNGHMIATVYSPCLCRFFCCGRHGIIPSMW
jgi:hypothetical protein